MKRGDKGFLRLAGRKLAVVSLAGLITACATTAGPISVESADIRMVGSRIFPESITSDAAGNVYVSSNDGTIYRAVAGSREAVPWIVPNSRNGLQSLFGVFANNERGLLWACSNPNLFAQPRQTGISALKAFDLQTGELKANFDFPASQPAACNDIAIAPDGTVFATETLAGRIFTLAPGGRELQVFASGSDLVGVDGIAFAGNGALYINNVRQHLVQRVERAADGAYAGLTTLTLSDELDGPDALRAIGGNRFLQAEGSGGRVALVTVNGDSAEVLPIRTGLDSSAGVTLVGDTAYATEGKIRYLIDPALQGQDPGPFVIRAFNMPEGT